MSQEDMVAQYRQAILDGLRQLTALELETLILAHFPKLHYGSSHAESCKIILEAPYSLLRLWTGVDKFLASQPSLARLVGEPPSPDQHNRSGRVPLLDDSPTRSDRTAVTEATADRSGRMVSAEISSGSLIITTKSGPISARSCDEITVEQPISPVISALIAAAAANQTSAPTPRSITASLPVVVPSQTSRHILIGCLVVWFTVVGLTAIHVCGPLKRTMKRYLAEAPAVASPPAAPALARTEAPLTALTVRSEVLVPPSQVTRPDSEPTTVRPPARSNKPHRGRGRLTEDNEPSKNTSTCEFQFTGWHSGQPVKKWVKRELHLPRRFNPGSKEAADWRLKECKRIRNEVKRRR